MVKYKGSMAYIIGKQYGIDSRYNELLHSPFWGFYYDLKVRKPDDSFEIVRGVHHSQTESLPEYEFPEETPTMNLSTGFKPRLVKA